MKYVVKLQLLKRGFWKEHYHPQLLGHQAFHLLILNDASDQINSKPELNLIVILKQREPLVSRQFTLK